MATLFTRIVNGELPAHTVAETDAYLAFLDIRPMTAGHTLCIIKREVDYIFDLSDDELSGLMLFAKRVAAGLKRSVACKRIAVGVLGLEVPHVHVHLVPVEHEGDFRFGKYIELADEEIASLAHRISAAIDIG